ncbi:MAG: type II toxin-antitoxin system RelE family toxin [Candidatus Methylomirabilis sp.]
MASYRLFIKPSAVKEIEATPKKDRQRIVDRIKRLSTDPRPPGCEKLSGQ